MGKAEKDINQLSEIKEINEEEKIHSSEIHRPLESIPSRQLSKEVKIKKKKKSKRRRRIYSSGAENACNNEVDQYISQKICEICLSQERDYELLLCDRCDDSYHRNCLDPPVQDESQVWICPICEQQSAQLQKQKEQKMKQNIVEKICYACEEELSRKHFLKASDNQGTAMEIECTNLTDVTCMYCKHSFHFSCYNERKNALNCSSCQRQIRTKGPKNHDAFMKYIEDSIIAVEDSDFSRLEHGEQNIQLRRHRFFNFRPPNHMTSWQFIAQYEASLYYAFATKKLTFIDDQIYRNEDKQSLMELNSPLKEAQGNILRLHYRDQKTYEAFKESSKKGFVGPFEVKQDRIKGFYLIATDHIPPFTIVSEYSGEVMQARQALKYQDNDSIFMLVKGCRSKHSLDIVPQKYGNIARFFSGINNSLKRAAFSRLQNIKSLRFSYKGRVHLLLYTTKPIQANETLYFDYNGSAFNEYPTDYFVE